MAARDAGDYVLGLTCMNDVTARELQTKDVQYTRAKGFDTFAPLGPCIAVGLDGSALGVEGWVNDQKKQASNTRQLIFPIDTLVEFVSFVMTLEPGDIIQYRHTVRRRSREGRRPREGDGGRHRHAQQSRDR